jgi:hypothetical protein
MDGSYGVRVEIAAVGALLRNDTRQLVRYTLLTVLQDNPGAV